MFAIIRRKHIIAALAVLLILAAAPAVIRRAQGAAVPASAQPSGNWGLSFQTEGGAARGQRHGGGLAAV